METTCDRVNKAVERLYDVFNRYPRPSTFSGCQCCIDRTQPRIAGKLTKDLLHADFSDYIIDAPFDGSAGIGTVNDFKHFLPRMLELMAPAHSQLGYPSDCLMRKLAKLDWRQWLKAEAEAIEEFFEAFWLDVLICPKNNWDADDFIARVAALGLDISPFLETWRVQIDQKAIKKFVAIRYRFSDWFNRKDDCADMPEQARNGRQWLTDSKTADWLEAAFFANSDSDIAAEISEAVDLLQLLSP